MGVDGILSYFYTDCQGPRPIPARDFRVPYHPCGIGGDDSTLVITLTKNNAEDEEE